MLKGAISDRRDKEIGIYKPIFQASRKANIVVRTKM
jgi:hypothetical protein